MLSVFFIWYPAATYLSGPSPAKQYPTGILTGSWPGGIRRRWRHKKQDALLCVLLLWYPAATYLSGLCAHGRPALRVEALPGTPCA